MKKTETKTKIEKGDLSGLTDFEIFTVKKLGLMENRLTTIETTFKIGKFLLIAGAAVVGVDVSGVM